MASHRSTNAEMFEILFEKLSDKTTKTWSKRIEDLPQNAILHLQAEKSNTGSDCILKEEREISKMAKSLPKLENAVIFKSELEKYAGDWAAHLKLISDFIKPGEGLWWKEMDDHIEFFDGPDEACFRQEGPQLHHLRSTSITREQELLEACWNKCLTDKVKIPATKLRGENGKWERLPICCSVDSTADSSADEGNSSNVLQTELSLGKETEDFSECDDEPEHDDDYETEGATDLRNMEVDPVTSSKPQAERETDMEVDPFISNELPQTESETDMEDERVPQPVEGNKRMRAEQESSSQEPPTKRQKADALMSRTSKAIEQVLGTCEEVQKYDKLKQNVAKNPKSRYHLERYEAHLTKIQILTLKAYKKVFNDIETWKDSFKSSMQREATDDDLRNSSETATKRKQMRTSLELLKLWKITVHLV